MDDGAIRRTNITFSSRLIICRHKYYICFQPEFVTDCSDKFESENNFVFAKLSKRFIYFDLSFNSNTYDINII